MTKRYWIAQRALWVKICRVLYGVDLEGLVVVKWVVDGACSVGLVPDMVGILVMPLAHCTDRQVCLLACSFWPGSAACCRISIGLGGLSSILS